MALPAERPDIANISILGGILVSDFLNEIVIRNMSEIEMKKN